MLNTLVPCLWWSTTSHANHQSFPMVYQISFKGRRQISQSNPLQLPGRPNCYRYLWKTIGIKWILRWIGKIAFWVWFLYKICSRGWSKRFFLIFVYHPHLTNTEWYLKCTGPVNPILCRGIERQEKLLQFWTQISPLIIIIT